MELTVLWCSSQLKTAIFCFSCKRFIALSESACMCRDARRVKWRWTFLNFQWTKDVYGFGNWKHLSFLFWTISNSRKHRKNSELQVRIELTTLRVLPWTEKAARQKKLLHRKLGHSTVRLPVENQMCFMKVYNVSLQGRNVGRVIGQRSRRFGVFTRKIKSHVWIRNF